MMIDLHCAISEKWVSRDFRPGLQKNITGNYLKGLIPLTIIEDNSLPSISSLKHRQVPSSAASSNRAEVTLCTRWGSPQFKTNRKQRCSLHT